MVLQLQGLLEKFGLIHHFFAFVKDENNNLGSMVITLWSIIDYKPLKMLWVYEGTYFGHVVLKVGQHTTNDDKVFLGPLWGV